VARALAAEPSILLMDEPFGALDPVTRVALAEDVRRLHEALGLTTVMVTHDVGEALLMADRVVVMAGGKIIADAAPAALMAGHSDPARLRPDRGAAAPGRETGGACSWMIA
jgi:osmoprotectant transport system ATP-binding protein